MNPPIVQPDARLVAIVTCPQFIGATDGGLYHFQTGVRVGIDQAYAHALQLATARIHALTIGLQQTGQN